MMVAIDIGNTSIHVGVFSGRTLRRSFSLPTTKARPAASGHGIFARLSRRQKADLSRARQALVCSVVPWATPAVVRALRQAGCPRVRVVGRDLRVPLKNRYHYPRQVGQDRLVGAYAAWRMFGDRAHRGRPGGRSPERARQRESRDCIVVDLGTAITIDLVTRHGEYLGGVIAPGLDISLEALAARTALLPKVSLRQPPELLGRDTANSIRSGILYGYAALCDGLVSRLKRRYTPKALVVATGGSSSLLARHARTIDLLKPHLVLEGLSRLSVRR